MAKSMTLTTDMRLVIAVVGFNPTPVWLHGHTPAALLVTDKYVIFCRKKPLNKLIYLLLGNK